MKYSVEYSIKSTLQSSTLQSNTHYIRKPLRLRTANCAPQTGHRTPMRDGRRGQGPGEPPQQLRHPPPCQTRHTARMSIRCTEKRCEGPCPRNAHRRSAERLYAALPFPGGALLAHFRRLCARPDALAPCAAVACGLCAAVRCCGRCCTSRGATRRAADRAAGPSGRLGRSARTGFHRALPCPVAWPPQLPSLSAG